jgi:uncharacterized membrane protein YkvA (DUF1232 family)
VDWLGSLAVTLGLLVAAWLLIIGLLWLHRPSRELVRPAVRLVPDLVRLVRRLLSEPDVPLSVRLALVGLLAWLVSPIDLIPEFIPGLGPLDDVVVAVLVLRFTVRRLGRARVEQLWPGERAGLALLWRLVGGAQNA